MLTILKTTLFVCAFSALCQAALGDIFYNVTLDTTPLVGHPAGPLYFEVVFTDGSGFGDGNNTVTLGDVAFGGGSALGSPFVFGGASGSLETGVTITDSEFLSLFVEQFTPGLQLSFSLGLTSNDDLSGIPDEFTFFILDNSGVPLPTLAPTGDYFITADLGSTGPVFHTYGTDPTRAPTVGDPITMGAPEITAAPVPEPGTLALLSLGLGTTVWWRRRSP